MFRTTLFLIVLSLVLIHFVSQTSAIEVSQSEITMATSWCSAKFEGKTVDLEKFPGLTVIANNDPVQKNRRNGNPMRMFGKQYDRGLYCHARSHVNVTLPAPGQTLIANIGVDENEQTATVDKATVVFVVKVGETEKFRSPVMRVKSEPMSIEVPLDGAAEFSLIIEDAGDGIGWDQANWADIRVVDRDGKIHWLDELPFVEQVVPPTCEPPFSFVYGDKSSAELLAAWPVNREKEKIDANRTRHVLTWNDPETRLEVRLIGIQYHDFPTVEWTVYFKNNGKQNTPILSEIKGLDCTFPGITRDQAVLHHHIGSPCRADDFKPLETVIKPGESKRITTSGGRPTNSDMPYFNVQGSSGGVIVVVGWSGQWAADFACLKDVHGVHVDAGQEKTHFTLFPGETARSSMTVLQFWYGEDRIRSQNVWRQWMLAHVMPHPHGKLIPPHFAACSSHQYHEMINATDETQMNFIDRYLAEGIKLDYWWMDAGWYVVKQTNNWPETGTWEVDRKRFPNGLRAISDHAHDKGVKIITWFEPERVHGGTWLAENHPEWILGGKNGGLLNLGDPEAWNWLVNHIDGLLTSEGIDFYRQDFNMDPLEHWQGNDPEDRQGMTENKHVVGYLAYWDELVRRHPGMPIDTCASGGRRLDIETLRRSVSLLRSDYILNSLGNQGHTYGLSFWIPLFGTGLNQSHRSALFGSQVGSNTSEPYYSRSAMTYFVNSCADLRVPADPAKNEKGSTDYVALKRFYDDWQRTASLFCGDFYPILPYSLDENVWMAWQFDLPEEGRGVVQLFRRIEAPYSALDFTFQGLDPQAEYLLEDADEGRIGVYPGKQLLENGITVTIKNRPDAKLLYYSQVR